MDLERLKLERRVDQLLAGFAGPVPGATIGVVRDGALAVHRHSGMASLELAQPIIAETTFRIASVSKQFTCAAVLKLAAEGRLSTGDDIRVHLPELPDLGPTSIDMILRNMSGIRDMLEIMRQGGMDLSVPCRTEDLLAGICRQTGTNFPPGERFLYSNSNFLLAGLIVERITGLKLGAYLQTHFFGPLGMGATRLTPEVAEIVPNLATGYLTRPEGGFMRAPHAFPLGGEGGLVSSVFDLALWDQALANGFADRAGLTEQAHFTNGVVCTYARGLVVAEHRGVRTEDHGGLWPGYRTAFLRAPDIATTVIAIANCGAIDPAQLAYATLDAVLDGRKGVHPVPKMPEPATLWPLAGRYLDASGLMTLDVAVSEAGAITVAPHGVVMAVKATDDGRLVAGKGAFALMIRPRDEALEIELPSGHLQHFTRVAEGALLPPDLDGVYHCPDMAAVWTVRGTTLSVSGPLIADRSWTLAGIDGDILRVHMPSVLFQGWLDVRLVRDADGTPTGLLVNGSRAKGLFYAKTG